jgi:hypothetical protein
MEEVSVYEFTMRTSAFYKTLADLGRIWTGRRPHPLGMMAPARDAAWLTGLYDRRQVERIV